VSKTRSMTTARSVTVTEKSELHGALRGAGLSREEELVLRMRHGLSAPRGAQLEFRGQGDPELATKLAMIEADALARVRPEATPEPDLEGEALKRAIIDRLRKL